MHNILLVMAGGSAGALARYALGTYVAAYWGTRFAWGTLVINLTGCLFIGLAFALGERGLLNPAARLGFMTGFLGAYTTFSTYGLETVNFARTGASAAALINIIVSNVCGVLLVLVGMWLGRLLLKG